MPTNSNPLLCDYDRIPFGEIEADHVVPGVRQILKDARAEIEELVAAESSLDGWTSRAIAEIRTNVSRKLLEVVQVAFNDFVPDKQWSFEEAALILDAMIYLRAVCHDIAGDEDGLAPRGVQNGLLSEYAVEGKNTNVFYPPRLNPPFPRPLHHPPRTPTTPPTRARAEKTVL